jgi:endo-1,4-beta-mannosidase
MDFIQVKKKHFTYKGEPIRLRGFGIGTWLNLEHFMIGLPTSEKVMRSAFCEEYGAEVEEEFFCRYREEFFKEEDFKLLKECGVNLIRIPFNYRLFVDDNHTEEYRQEGFMYLDSLFARCKKYEIFAMIDLHTTPGAQNPDWHSDNSNGVPLFWEYQIFRRQMTRLWAAIASRYSEEPFLMGYDLLNEPAMVKWPMINEFYEETIDAIRAVDKNHVIVLEGDQFSMDFSGLKNINDKQLALSFHYYPTVWHSDLLDRNMDRNLRRQRIAEGLDRLVSIRDQFECPAFCGEFGYGADCGDKEFTMELLKDTLGLMEERQIDWLLWCYKDARFMSMVSPREDSEWMKLAMDIEEEWTQDIEKEQASRILELIEMEWFQGMTEEESYLLQFRIRACLYVLQRSHILLPRLKEISSEEILHLPNDFSIENCEVYKEFMDLMKSVLL